MNFKKIKAKTTTHTYNREEIEGETGNLYESISIVAKRAMQINTELAREILAKLEEFGSFNSDNLEEVFENKEQIEVSKFYERLPKPHAIAVQEWLDDNIYYRIPEKENDDS